MRVRRAALAAALAALAGGLVTSPVTAAEPASGPAGDFDGNGYPDLVIASPEATIDEEFAAGVVVVLYGSADGYAASRSAILTPGVGLPGAPERVNRFGSTVTSGDLDDDGFADLVVGGIRRTTVIWGSPDGLVNGATTLPFIGDVAAVGDFDGDGAEQLAVISWEELRVYQEWTSRPTPPQATVTTDGLGAPTGDTSPEPVGLVAGDFTGSGHDDLVAYGGEFQSGDSESSSWHYSYTAGPDGVRLDRKFPGRNRITTTADVGDVNGDGFADLVSGQPRLPAQNGSDEQIPGAITVHYGSPNGLRIDEPQVIDQDTDGVPGEAGLADFFGVSVSVADGDRDGYADVAIGVPRKQLRWTGEVVLLTGSPDGLTTGRNAVAISRETAGVPGTVAEEAFGHGVHRTADRDGSAWLAVSAPMKLVDDGYPYGRDGTVALLRLDDGNVVGDGLELIELDFDMPLHGGSFGTVLGPN